MLLTINAGPEVLLCQAVDRRNVLRSHIGVIHWRPRLRSPVLIFAVHFALKLPQQLQPQRTTFEITTNKRLEDPVNNSTFSIFLI